MLGAGRYPVKLPVVWLIKDEHATSARSAAARRSRDGGGGARGAPCAGYRCSKPSRYACSAIDGSLRDGAAAPRRLRTPVRPVHRIADDAQPERGEVHPDLVGPPSRQRQVQTRRERAERLLHALVGERVFAALDHRHAFAVLGIAPDRPVDRAARAGRQAHTIA